MSIPTLEDLANFTSVLDLAAKVFRHFAASRRTSVVATAENDTQIEAIDTTLTEWENLVINARPDLAERFLETKDQSYLRRSAFLCNLAAEYPNAVSLKTLASIPLVHTRIEVLPGGEAHIHFGESKTTETLSGQVLVLPRNTPLAELRINGENMVIPSFKVTMLGDSGSGKTVFMSSMYAKLREGHRGISIRAVDDAVDLELGDTMEGLYQYHKWPPGTDLAQKRYDFELLVGRRVVSRIDWVDYRGGALLEEPESEGGKTLASRLRESQAIIWMVDMTRLDSQRLDGMRERIQTRVARMAAICRHAVQENDDPRSWIFVRTKADTVRGADGNPDWHKACADLIKHLGPTVTVATSGGNSRAAALPVSSVGRLSNSAERKVEGDDPSFVEWPLLLSLAFLAQTEIDRLRLSRYYAQIDRLAERPGTIEGFARNFLKLGPSETEMAAIEKLGAISKQILGIHSTIAQILQGCPPIVKLLQSTGS